MDKKWDEHDFCTHLTLRMSAATIPTTMDVVVEEDCTSTVDSTPSITPTTGF